MKILPLASHPLHSFVIQSCFPLPELLRIVGLPSRLQEGIGRTAENGAGPAAAECEGRLLEAGACSYEAALRRAERAHQPAPSEAAEPAAEMERLQKEVRRMDKGPPDFL